VSWNELGATLGDVCAGTFGLGYVNDRLVRGATVPKNAIAGTICAAASGTDVIRPVIAPNSREGIESEMRDLSPDAADAGQRVNRNECELSTHALLSDIMRAERNERRATVTGDNKGVMRGCCAATSGASISAIVSTGPSVKALGPEPVTDRFIVSSHISPNSPRTSGSAEGDDCSD